MSLVQINWKPGPRELREFGIAMLIGFGLIGVVIWFKWHNLGVAAGCWVFGAVSGLLGLSGTRAALPIYRVWMGIAFVMGNLISRICLVVFFYGLITPMGLIRRLIGRDALGLRARGRPSYWHDLPARPVDRQRYERQF